MGENFESLRALKDRSRKCSPAPRGMMNGGIWYKTVEGLSRENCEQQIPYHLFLYLRVHIYKLLFVRAPVTRAEGTAGQTSGHSQEN